MRFQSFVQTMSGSFSRRNTSSKLNDTFRTAVSVGLALTAVLCSATAANAQGVRLDPTIITYAGNGSLTNNNSGNGGLATAAGLNNPEGIAYDSRGLTYIADYGNNTIRTVTSAGVINAFAGTGAACTAVIAGADTACGDGGPASAATFNNPTEMQFDSQGNLYIADFNANRIRKITATNGVITPASIVTTVVGTGTASVTGNTGLATAATINRPHGLALDAANNLYIGEQSGCVVQYVPAANGNLIIGGVNTAVTAGHIYTIAGQAGNCGYISDANGTTQGTASELNAPTGISLDSAANVYIGDYSNYRVRKLTRATGVITTIAGTATQCPVNAPTTGAAPAATPACGDGGLATAATLNGPTGVYVDGSGNVIIGDAFGARVREINGTTKIMSTLSGTSQQCTNISQTTTFSDGTGNVLNFPNCGDGTAATKALVSFPILISVNPQGNILYVDQYDNKVREIVEHIVFAATNVGSSSATQNVNLITTGTANTIITSITVPNDANGQPEFTLGTITGCTIGGTTGNAPGVDCTIPVTFNPAYAGPISQPLVVVTNGGTFQFGLTGTGVAPVAVLAPGQLSTVVGTGVAGTTGNGGQATAATLNTPRDLGFDPAGNYYIGDLVSNEIRKVTPAGVISVYAGGGTTNYITTPGGAATAAALSFPTQVAFDAAGNGYIPDFNNHVVARVDAVTNAITVFAGTGVAGYSGDGGLATAAQLSGPASVVVDQATGNVYIADPGTGATSNQTIRLVNAANGIISTFAGNGTACASPTAACGDGGLATSAQLNQPNGLALDVNGNLYISDTIDNRVRVVNKQTGNIAAFAGTGTAAYTGDGGAATSAALNDPFQIQLDAAGDLYIADRGNNVIRFVSAATGNISTIAGNGTACTTVPSPACGDGGPANVSAFSAPDGVALDASGNIYVAEAGTNRVRKITTNPTNLPFPPAPAIGVTEGPLTAMLYNIGNATLTYTTPVSPNSNAKVTTTSNPTTGTATPVTSNAFAQTNATTCGPIFSTSGATTLASGASCNYVVTFTPDTAVGNYVGTLVETDNSLYSGTGNTLYPTPLTQTVNLTGSAVQGTATVLLSSSVNPSLVGQSVTFTATLSGGGVAPTGTVTFTYTTAGSTTPVTINVPATISTTGGVTTATVTTSALPLGTDTVTATYNGDTNYVSGTTSSTLAQVVNQVPGTPADKVSAASGTITYGTADQLTFSIPVVANAGVPTGTVVFTAGTGSTSLGTATWPATPVTGNCPGTTGTCYLLTDSTAPTNIPVGAPTTVTATYTALATSGYASSAPTTTVTVSQAPLSNDSLTSAPTPTTTGTLVTATFFIPVPTGDTAPTGTVSFSSPGATFSTPTALTPTTINGVTGYAATATTSNLPVGSDTITGTLTNTDPNYAGGSLTTTEVVNPVANTGEKVTAASASITYGTSDQLTFSIPVVAGAAVPAGTVTFTSGTTSLGTATWPVAPATPITGPCPGGTGTCYLLTDSSAPTNIPVGAPTTVTAAFAATPTSGYASGIPTTTVTVAKAPLSNDSLTSSPTPTNSGTLVTATFFIPVPTGDVAPTGTVSFSSPGATFSTPTALTATTINGVTGYSSTATSTNLPVGSDTITGTLTNTDPNYAGGSLTTTEVINQNVGTGEKVSAASASITYGTSDQLTYSIPVVANSAAPAGTVTFTAGTTALGSATWPATPVTGTCPGGTGTCYLLTDATAPTNIPVGAPTTVTGTFAASAGSGYASAAPTTTVTVAQAPVSANTLSVSPNPAASGATVTVSYFIPVPTGDTPPTGPVTFTSPGATFSTPTAFTATTVNGVTGYISTATTTNLPTGTDTVTGTYTSSDPNYAGGPLTTPETINPVGNTGDAVAASPSPTTVGSSTTLTFTIPVVAGAAVPTGTVTFTSGTTALGSATWPATPTITGGNYVLSTTTTALPLTVSPATSTPITATYAPGTTSGYGAAAPTTTDVVNQVSGTTDAVTPANTTSTVGTADALTYSIPVIAGVPVPAGSITFTSGTTSLGSATWPAAPTTGTCPSGSGTCYLLADTPAPTNIPLTVAPATSTPITASFTATPASGYASAAPTTAVTVGAAGGSGDTLTVANSPTTFGTADTLTFNIPATSGVPAPSGTVVFTATGGVALGSATWPANPTVTNGDYSLSVSPTNIPVGSPTTVTATFTASPTSGYGSASPSNTVIVNKVPVSNDGISANPSATSSGQTVTLSFTVPNVNGTAPSNTATVTFTTVINGATTTLGTANLVGTTANNVTTYTTTTTALPVGNDIVTGTFTGDGNYAGGALTTPVGISSNTTTDTVSVATNPTTVETADTITFSIPVTNGAALPTGMVTFTSGSTTLGTATWPASPTVTGSNYTLSISTTALPLTVAPATSTPVLATYAAGTTSGYSSTSASTTVVVNQVGTAGDAVTVTNNPTTVGTADPITFSIPVVTGAPVPSGSVAFTSGTTNLGTATWPAAPVTGACPSGGGTCYILADSPTPTNLPLTVSPATSTPVTATFTATSNSGYASGSSSTTVVVNPAGSTGDTLTVATNPTTYGTADTLTFAIPVSSGVPAPLGTVVFTAPGGVTLGTATWSGTPTQSGGNYVVSVSPTNIPVGAPTTVTATFTASAGSGYSSGVATAPVTVTQVPITNDGISANPSATTSGQTVVLSFTVPNVNSTAPAANSTVTFTAVIGGVTTTLGTASVTGTTTGGVTTYTTSTAILPVGNNTVTGTFSGDTNYAGGSLTTSVAIASKTTTDTVTVATNPTTVASPDTITFSIPVSGGAAVPAGTVTFTSGSVTLGTATWPATPTITGGNYTLSISTTTLPLTIAPSTSTPVLATFTSTGASGYAGTTASTTVVVNQVSGTGDAVTAANTTTTVGTADPLTFSIPVVTGAPVPTGSVNFTSGTTSLGSATWPATPTTGPCPGGSGTCYLLPANPSPTNIPLTVAPATSTPVTATYTAGSASGYASTTATTNVDVTPVGGTGGTLSVATNPTIVGAADTLTFSIPVNSGAPAPAGTVVFTAGTVNLGSATWPANPTPVNGFYTISVSPTNIPLGNPTQLTATFSPTAGSGYGASAPTASVTVTQIPGTGDTLVSNPNPSIFGQTVTLTETVPTVNGITPTGTVTFFYNGTQIGTGTLTNGVVTATTSTLPVGNDPLTATYSGDTNYASVTDNVTQVVSVAPAQATLAAGPNPASFGQTVTLTETLVPINGVCPPGPVTFFSNGTQIGTPATVNAQCVATITTSTLPVGSDAITATAPASGSFAAVTSGPVALVINQYSGADTLNSNPNPSIFGNNVTITDTIPTVGGVAPTGTVNFYDFGTLIGTGTVNASGVATLVTSALPVGTDSLTAIYQGDTNYAQVTAGPVNQVVSPVATTPTLSVGPNPTTFGTPVTVTETIPVVNGTPATGTVIFSQNGNVIGTGTINAQGVASYTTTTLPVGTDPITATYAGDTNYAPINSGPVPETINKANGADNLVVSPDPSVFGNTVTITDTVPTVGGVAPTGTVTFTNNGTTIGTAPIVNGVATLTTTTLPVGSDPISGAYSGDNNYAPVTTGPVNEIITTGNTTPVLGATPNPTTFGTPVTLTESIPGINGVTPTGSVQFFDNGTLIGTGTVNAQGVATFVTSTLPIGTDPITATYSGDTNYAGGTTAPLNVVINKAAPIDTLSSAPTPTTFGTQVTATFTVPLVNGVVPTGVVSFYNGTTLIGTGNVNASGVATITTSNLPVGTDTITAKYPGDNNYAAASPTTTEVVGLATGAGDTLTSSPNPSNFGQSVTITETLPTVGGVAPTGTVTFFNNGAQIGTGPVSNGVATLNISTLPAGNDPITATYSGDGNYATVNSGPETQVVDNTTSPNNLTANPNPGTFGVPVLLTETITPINGLCPAGPATFLDNGTSIGTGTVSLMGGQCVATLTTSTLPVGNNPITATVPASNGFGPISTGPLNLPINKAPGTNDSLSTSPNPSTFGQTVTLTEVLPSVNGVAPTGTVVFTYNGATLGTGTVMNGVAMISTGTLPAGSDPITATYSGDANFATVTSGPVTQVVNAGPTSATLAVGPNPSTFGTPVTLTETIAPINGDCPAGPATFLNNGTSIGTGVISLVNGSCVATLTTSNLPVGSDAITATVPGNGMFSPITSGPVALVVSPGNGPDTLAANPNPSVFGNNVTLTDTIPTVGGVAPTGTVNFYDFGTLIGTGTVTNGVATLVTGTLPVGTDSITATYLGDPNYAQVTAGPVNEVVTQVSSTPTLAVGPNPATFGTPVTVTETIPVVNGVPATGTVTFLSNGNVIGTGTINPQGVASITTTTLPVGTDNITATYPGNTNYAPVNASPVPEVINKANGPDTLTVNPDPSLFGQNVTLTDTIPTVGGVAPTGTVNFYDNGTLIGTGTVNAQGVATLTTGSLPVGSDPITAVYSGDSNYASVTAGPVNEVVTQGNTSPVLGATPNPTTFGTTVTLTEAIPGVNGVTPTGTVNFYDNGKLIGTGTLTNGVATLSTSTLPIGTDPITATYSGDGNYSAANSGPLNVVINPSNLPDTVTVSPTSPTFGAPATITFTVPIVNGVVPTGVVTFYDGTTVIGTGTIGPNGVATITTSTLPAGTTTVTAKYPGDGTYAPQSPTTTVTVGPGTPLSTVTSNVPTGTTPGCGTSVTLTDTITQINGATVSGTVQFYDNGIAIGAPVTVSAGGVATFTTTTLPCGATNSITAVFTPSAGSPYASSTGGPFTLPVAAPDFAITASPANQIINPGDSATYTVSLSGVTVPFTSPVALTATCNCQGVTISFANPTVTPGQGPTSTTMTIVTSPTFAMAKPARSANNIFYGLLLLPLLGLGSVRRKLRKLPKGISYCLAALVFLGGLGAVTGCGGGYYGPTPKTCTITITGTSGTITHSTTVTVTVR